MTTLTLNQTFALVAIAFVIFLFAVIGLSDGTFLLGTTATTIDNKSPYENLVETTNLVSKR